MSARIWVGFPQEVTRADGRHGVTLQLDNTGVHRRLWIEVDADGNWKAYTTINGTEYSQGLTPAEWAAIKAAVPAPSVTPAGVEVARA